MKTIKFTYFISILGTAFLFSYCSKHSENLLFSPNKDVRVDFEITHDQKATYSVSFKEQSVIHKSSLGIIREDADFTNSLKLDSVSGVDTIYDDYILTHGKKTKYSYTGFRKIFHLSNANGGKMDIIFQVSDDGVGFRYYFPEISSDTKKIVKENTGFSLSEKTKCWIQPITPSKSGWGQVQPSYEEHYVQDFEVENLTDTTPGWVFPALFKSGNIWVHITETFPLRNYCGSRLIHESQTANFTIGFPQKTENFPGGEVNPASKLPWYTPWRIITIGDSLKNIVESTLGTDLAEPSRLPDVSYIKPGRSSWSWVLLKDDSTVYDVQKRFVDYAADMGWEYCLVDAFWDQKIGFEKIKELVKYAETKRVGIVLWYNSAGDWNTTVLSPKSKLLTHTDRVAEFSKLKEFGVKGVKVDFFGADGQSMMAYYIDIIEDAAKYGLMVNCHGSTLPRGLHRTYPNLVSMEAIRGFEFVTFEQVNADRQPNHCCVIPFTRNVNDPMDFTPVCFSEVPNMQRKTSNAFELAVSVLFLSGLQHYAEVPQGMIKMPDYVKNILKAVPVSWNESKFVDGYPGKFVVIARRDNATWYVAGINGENQDKTIKVTLPFINRKEGVLISDGETNRSFSKNDIELNDSKSLNITIKANGGFLLIF
jgi:hypothetical protein